MKKIQIVRIETNDQIQKFFEEKFNARRPHFTVRVSNGNFDQGDFLFYLVMWYAWKDQPLAIEFYDQEWNLIKRPNQTHKKTVEAIDALNNYIMDLMDDLKENGHRFLIV